MASRIEPGFKDLANWIGITTNFDRIRHGFSLQDPKAFSKQRISGKRTNNNQEKPIIGLFENLAVFVFLGDYDTIGNGFGNVGLIEHDDHFQAIKIDPEQCTLSFFPSKPIGPLSFFSTDPTRMFDKTIDSLFNENKDFVFRIPFGKLADKGINTQVFRHATQEQVMDGIHRIVKLSDQQLHTVIFNREIVGLPDAHRKHIYDELIKRRDKLREMVDSGKKITMRKQNKSSNSFFKPNTPRITEQKQEDASIANTQTMR
ncbi:hypothetical protein [Rickettsiella massiliensis]|uniref:hypothetical protein n=1 Tax=Rickettsiella massiliensis TaxID=676517 RepID=UPI00029ADC21|nr:hypothetical protein [Rickettsiella massiliensis]